MGNGDPIGINGKFSVCSPVNVLPDLRADAWKRDVVEDSSSTSNDRGAEEGFRPFEVHELTRALDRQGAACRDVEVLIELCQMGSGEHPDGPLGACSPLDALCALRSSGASVPLEASLPCCALGSSGACVPLEALEASLSCCALGSWRARVPLEALEASLPCCTLGSQGACVPLEALEASLCRIALQPLEARAPLKTLRSLRARQTLGPLKPLVALMPLIASISHCSLESLGSFCALDSDL